MSEDRNRFIGDPNIELEDRGGVGKDPRVPTLLISGEYMKKDEVIVRFVQIRGRFTGEIQFGIDHPQKDLWYAAVEPEMNKIDRIVMLGYENRQLVELPITISMEEEEQYEDIINDFYNVIMKNKPKGI